MKEQEQKKTGLPAEQTALKKASDELILAVDAAEKELQTSYRSMAK